MARDLIDEVNLLRNKGDYQYIINRYIDRNLWVNRLKKIINNKYCYNMTDFNYSTCFTVWINLTDSEVEIGGEEFNKFIEINRELLIMSIEISVIAPYYVLRYLKYTKDNVKCDFETFSNEYQIIEKSVCALIESKGNKRLYKEELDIVIPGIELELKEENVTVYNCLFEDSY